jgi:hypothetical protein
LHEQLKKLTEELLKYNNRMLEIAEHTHNSNTEPDFFGTVKPFADEIKQTVDEWKAMALRWMQLEKPRYIHSLQIESVSENLERMSVEAFYRTHRLSRIKQFHQSIEYTLTLIVERLQELSKENSQGK